MVQKLQCVFVNKFVKKNDDTLIMQTWFEDAPYSGFWETDAKRVIDGSANNKDWLTMHENLRACHRAYKDKPIEQLDELLVFKVRIEYEKTEDDAFISAKVIKEGF